MEPIRVSPMCLVRAQPTTIEVNAVDVTMAIFELASTSSIDTVESYGSWGRTGRGVWGARPAVLT